MGDVSEEHGERFHQDIKQMEQRYVGHWEGGLRVVTCSRWKQRL